jgi:hypothetical protein
MSTCSTILTFKQLGEIKVEYQFYMFCSRYWWTEFIKIRREMKNKLFIVWRISQILVFLIQLWSCYKIQLS